MAKLNNKDFNDIIKILASLPLFQNTSGRYQLLSRSFKGQPRGNDILSVLEYEGAAIDVATNIISKLNSYGHITDGQEALGILLNNVAEYFGEETDEARTIKYVISTYQLDQVIISNKSIIEDTWYGEDNSQAVQEKIIGENTLRPIYYLQLALEAAKSVVRIRVGRSFGSGFLCGKNLIMTNNHVIKSPDELLDSSFFFNYQLNISGEETESLEVKNKQNGLFYTNPELDFSVIEVDSVPDNVEALTLKPTIINIDDRATIIQHPGGYFKQISMQNNFVVYADNKTVQYVTSTNPGSSGSPVFDDNFEVIAIHHSGGNLPDPNTNRRYLRNEGSSMIAVLKDIKANHQEIATILS